MPERWTIEDLIVLVYFRSRGVLTRTIKDLIHQKGGTLRNRKHLTSKLGRLHREERNAGRPATYDETTKTWDLQVTDQWLVDHIVRCAEAKAIMIHGENNEAPSYYDGLKALTYFSPIEKHTVEAVSIGRSRVMCSPYVDNSPQIQRLDPIRANLAWTVELPTSPANRGRDEPESAN